MEAWKDELYHHGILGQKWGVRNGTTYPLSSSQHSAAEKKAGWRQSLGKTIKDYRTKKKRQKSAEKARIAKQKKAEELKNREENLKNPLWVQKHYKELTNDELKKVTDRFTAENNLRRETIKKMNAGKEYVDMILGYTDTAINTYDKTMKVVDRVNEIKNRKSKAEAEKKDEADRAKFKEEAEKMTADELLKAVQRNNQTDRYVNYRMNNRPKDEPEEEHNDSAQSGKKKDKSDRVKNLFGRKKK